MKAAFYESFKGPVTIKQLPDPSPAAHDVIIQVKATGLCRSDWHGWQGMMLIFIYRIYPDTNWLGSSLILVKKYNAGKREIG